MNLYFNMIYGELGVIPIYIHAKLSPIIIIFFHFYLERPHI